MKTILIVAAHPDDEVLGCFGTVAKLLNNGGGSNKQYEAFSLILSGGKKSRGQVDDIELENLKKEMLEANKLIGIKEVFGADFSDNSFDTHPRLQIIKKIEEIKQKIKPDIIFTHHSGDMNIDHQITQAAVLTATRPMSDECVKEIYSFYVPSSTEWGSFSVGSAFIPNVFFDISDTLELKISAMAKYKSELRDYPHPRSLQHIRELAIVEGAKVGLKAAESFMCLRKIIN